jgi:hypothetical protein
LNLSQTFTTYMRPEIRRGASLSWKKLADKFTSQKSFSDFLKYVSFFNNFFEYCNHFRPKIVTTLWLGNLCKYKNIKNKHIFLQTVQFYVSHKHTIAWVSSRVKCQPCQHTFILSRKIKPEFKTLWTTGSCHVHKQCHMLISVLKEAPWHQSPSFLVRIVLKEGGIISTKTRGFKKSFCI